MFHFFGQDDDNWNGNLTYEAFGDGTWIELRARHGASPSSRRAKCCSPTGSASLKAVQSLSFATCH
jgi:hypothetical protein